MTNKTLEQKILNRPLVSIAGYKYTRPKLTAKQIFALGAVRDNKLKKQHIKIGWQVFQTFSCEGVDITTQLKALRKRRLIKNDWRDAARTDNVFAITEAGAAVLHLVGG